VTWVIFLLSSWSIQGLGNRRAKVLLDLVD